MGNGANQFQITCIGVQHLHPMVIGNSCKQKGRFCPFTSKYILTNNNNECEHGELEGDARNQLWLEPGVYFICAQ